MPPRVKVKRLHPQAVLPRYMTADAAGMDLVAAFDGSITIPTGARSSIPTGLAFEIPRGFEGQLRPRSGLAKKFGITLANSPATIDADYRGEVIVVLINHGEEPVTIKAGERICQMVVAPVEQAEVEEVSELSDTVRGAGGFGSTGV